MANSGEEQYVRYYERPFLKRHGLERIFSKGDHFEKRDGKKVQPQPIPGGLFVLEAKWGGSENPRGIEPDPNLRERVKETGANAAELLFAARDYALQLYRI